MPFPFPKTFTKCGKIWKGLNHVLWSNWQEGEDLRVNMWNQGEGEQAAALMGWTQPLQVSQEHIHVTAMVKAMGQAVTVVLRNEGATAQAELLLLGLHCVHLLQLHVPTLVQNGWSPGYPTALRQAQIQGKREAGREEVIWPKTCLEIPRVLLESSARARFLPTELSKFLSATINAMFSLLRIMDCSIRQKIFLLLAPSSKMGLSLASNAVLFQWKHVSVLWAHPSSL